MATYSVNQENHKYQDSYEQSYVYKIFTFKFVNTNIQIFYQAFYYQNFDEFYYMLLGMSITKSVTIFFMKHIKKLLKFWIAKLRYFYRLERLAVNQKD
jgi:Calcium-activated chloride channel